MRNSLSLSGVFCSIPGVEKTSLYANKSIVVLAFQEAGTVAIDDRDSSWVCDGDVVGLDADEFAVGLVCLVYGEVASSSAALVHEPEIGKGCREGCGYIADGPVAEIG